MYVEYNVIVCDASCELLSSKMSVKTRRASINYRHQSLPSLDLVRWCFLKWLSLGEFIWMCWIYSIFTFSQVYFKLLFKFDFLVSCDNQKIVGRYLNEVWRQFRSVWIYGFTTLTTVNRPSLIIKIYYVVPSRKL